MKINGKEMSFVMFCKKAINEVVSIIAFQLSKIVPDKWYIQHKYKRLLDKKLDLNNPMTFNEKINWIKLYDRNALYSSLADKFMVREYVKEKIGEEYLVPIVGVWDKAENIDFDKLPEQFVLKCTHDSASVCICKEKSRFDITNAVKLLNTSLKKNYYWYSREWVYKNCNPRIIAEIYLEDESGDELKDYKIFCFDGVPKVIQVDFGRFTKHERNMYTVDWDNLDLTYNYERNPNVIIEKPEKLGEMLSMAEKLSNGIPFVRTDFYSIYDKIYFGEMTFYPEAGFGRFEPEQWDGTWGEWITLPQMNT